MNTKRIFRPAVFIVAVSVMVMVSASAPCVADCNCNDAQNIIGNIDTDPDVNPMDLVRLIRYVCMGDQTAKPVNDCDAEINGYCNPMFICEPSLGDVLALIDYVYQGGTLTPCTQGINVPPGNLAYIFPGMVTIPPGTGTMPLNIDLINTGGMAVDLRGYACAIAAYGVGTVTINQIDINSRFNPGGWTEETIVRLPYKTVVYAYADDLTNTTPINPGIYPSAWIQLTLHYTNSGGPTQIPVMAYQESPGDYCAYYTPGMTMARGVLQASVDEYLAPISYVEEPDLTVEIPSSSTPGLIVLITALVLTGALCIMAYRRFRMAQ